MTARYRLSPAKISSTGIALVAFGIYIATSLLLPWAWEGPYCCEPRGFAVAVSNIVYGAPLGTMRADVVGYFDAHAYQPLGQTLDGLTQAIPVQPDPAPGLLRPTTDDGNGIGYPLFATAAFRLFGVHPWATLSTMFLVMAISAVAFLCRFGHRLASVVTLYFVTLTALLFTYIVWRPEYRMQIELSGIRYFSLLAVLPVLHILLHMLEQPATEAAWGRRGYVPLGIQAAVLALAILVRTSAASWLGAIGTVWLFLVWRRRRRRPLFRDAALVGVVGVALIAALIYVMPKAYRTDGRVGTVVWHRLVVSLTNNPHFPFPGMEQMFDDCVKQQGGLRSGMGDRNAGCIWADYQLKHHLPVDIPPYSGEYEAVIAKQFFKILRAYPHDVFDTFFYYKPLMLRNALNLALRTNFTDDLKPPALADFHFFPYPGSAIALLVVALILGFAHLFAAGWTSLPAIGETTGVALWMLLWTLPPYFVAWGNPATIADLTFYLLFCAALMLAGVLPAARLAARRLRLFGGYQA